MAKQPLGDVVVLLPGILGSVLARDGKDVWAPSAGAIGRALWTLGRSVTSLELRRRPVGARRPRRRRRGAAADVDGVHLIPGLLEHRRLRRHHADDHRHASTWCPARPTSSSPTTGGGTTAWPPASCSGVVDEKLHAQRQRNPDAKVILIGHSMGGLVARWYLECLGGWQDTRALITFGTPHRGSLNAADFLVNGFVKKLGPLKVADLSRAAALADVRLPAAADLPVRRRRRREPARRRGRAARRRPGPRRSRR